MPRQQESTTRRRVGTLVATVAGAAVLALGGCAGTPIGARTTPSPAPSGPTSAAVGSTSIPSSGVTLAALGFDNGPRDAFSVPRTAYLSATSDQPSLVTLVFAAPDPTRVYAYLAMALPRAGFEITARLADPTTPTLSFVGHGWVGNFTGDTAAAAGGASASAVTLRPVG